MVVRKALIIRNSTFITAARMIDVVCSFVFMFLAARYLDLDRMGNYVFSTMLVTIFMPVISLGLNSILIREVARHPEKTAEYFGTCLILFGVFILVGFLILAGVLHFFGDAFRVTPLMSQAIYLSCIAFWVLNNFSNGCVALFYANERMGYDAVLQTIESFTMVAGMGLIMTLDLGFLAIFYLQIVAMGLTAVTAIVLVHRNLCLPKFRLNTGEWKYFLGEGYPQAFFELIRRAMVQVDVYVLQFMNYGSMLALFSVPYRLLLRLNFFPRSLALSVFPQMSRSAHDGDNVNIRENTIFAFQLLSFISFPLTVVLFCGAEDIMGLFGKSYLPAATTLRILAWIPIPMFLNAVMAQSMTAVGTQRRLALLSGGCLLLNLALDILLIPRLGYLGAAWATVGANFVFGTSMFISLVRAIGQLPLLRIFGKPILASAGLAALLYGLGSRIPFPVSLVLSGAVYLLALVLLGVLRRDQLQLMRRAFAGGPKRRRGRGLDPVPEEKK